jgi:hypothetical protein
MEVFALKHNNVQDMSISKYGKKQVQFGTLVRFQTAATLVSVQCTFDSFNHTVEAGSVWTKSGDVKKNGRRKSKVWIRRTMVNPASCFIHFDH